MPITRLSNDNPTSQPNQPAMPAVREEATLKPAPLPQDSYTSSAIALKPKPSPHKGLLGDFEAVAHKLESFISVVIFANTMQSIERSHKQEQQTIDRRDAEAHDEQYAENVQKAAQQADAKHHVAVAEAAKHAQ
jgi:hypothetical protein